jgi:Phosphotriesterase family
MTLSRDYCSTVDWFPAEQIRGATPNWSMTFLFEDVIPTLKAEGMTDEQLDQMMVDNLRHWLTAKEPGASARARDLYSLAPGGRGVTVAHEPSKLRVPVRVRSPALARARSRSEGGRP